MYISLTIYFFIWGKKYQIYILKNEMQLQKIQKIQNMKNIINAEIPRPHIQFIYLRYL